MDCRRRRRRKRRTREEGVEKEQNVRRESGKEEEELKNQAHKTRGHKQIIPRDQGPISVLLEISPSVLKLLYVSRYARLCIWLKRAVMGQFNTECRSAVDCLFPLRILLFQIIVLNNNKQKTDHQFTMNRDGKILANQ